MVYISDCSLRPFHTVQSIRMSWSETLCWTFWYDSDSQFTRRFEPNEMRGVFDRSVVQRTRLSTRQKHMNERSWSKFTSC